MVNGTGSSRLAEQTLTWLKDLGFQAYSGGRRPGGAPLAVSEAVEHGSLARSGRRVLAALGVAGKVSKDPNHRRGADVTLLLGKDVARNPNIAQLNLEDRDLTAYAGRSTE